MSDTQTLNALMEFDHVIIVHDDGTITDAPNDRRYWAPDLNDDDLSRVIIDGQLVDAWQFFTTGYSGQDRYSGPIMHNSEFIGGGLERDIRETPGVYVALVSYYTNVCSECHEDTIRADEDDTLRHENAEIDSDHEATDDETYAEGWAIARLKDEYVPDGATQ